MNTLTLGNLMNILQKNACRCLFVATVIISVGMIANPARADFDEEVEKVNTMSDTIAGIVSTMTDVAILPMGIGASMRVFRHIVLQNV